MTDDTPLCGDLTCEGAGCRQSAVDAWVQRQEDEARELVRGLLLTPEQAYADKDKQRGLR